MWLLSTDRAELHYFSSPEALAKSDGYAILSHVWEPPEQSFQSIQTLAASLQGSDASPRDQSCTKIRECCMLAEKHGHKWVWIDTCCIDKTSSADLSEAINSMFRYYALADVCYAYLKDVPSSDDSFTLPPFFQYSKWHTRGWTLQELIAPRFLLFVSQAWEPLGTKADLAFELSAITHIPERVLRQEQDFREISIAQRMSWAAKRETTREEDRAYSLFGIFGVNLPTLYGEGGQAFQRLQEEIIRRYADTSLFAWGYFSESFEKSLNLSNPGSHWHAPTSYLFAASPSDFYTGGFMHISLRRGSIRQEKQEPQTVM
jgi:hypothetical protein